MKINEIKHRHYLIYVSETDELKVSGYLYLTAHVLAGIKAGIIEGVDNVDELKPGELVEIGAKLTKAIKEALRPETKN